MKFKLNFNCVIYLVSYITNLLSLELIVAEISMFIQTNAHKNEAAAATNAL